MNPYAPDPGIAARIQDYLDGALTPSEERAFEARIAASPELRDEVEGWRALYGRLDALPRIAPSPAFADRVLRQLPARGSLGDRVRRWFGGGVPGAARGEQAEHPGADRLQDYAEGILALPLAARVEAHLGDCPRCRVSVAAFREVVGALESLPRLEPSPGFAERVMAALPAGQAGTLGAAAPRPARSAAASAWGWLAAAARKLVPSTRRGWSVAAVAASLPVALVTAAVGYLMTHPLLTPGHLVSFALWRTADRWAALQATVSGWLMESVAAFRAASLVEAVLGSPGVVAGGAVVFCLGTLASLWVLWRFLLSSPEEGRHAHVPA